MDIPASARPDHEHDIGAYAKAFVKATSEQP